MRTHIKRGSVPHLILKALAFVLWDVRRSLLLLYPHEVYQILSRSRMGLPISLRAFNRGWRELDKKGLISCDLRGPKIRVKFTNAGKMVFRDVECRELEIKKQKKWDGITRLIIFDIPEELKRVRNAFRAHLKRLGCKQVQLSVWACLYPCKDVIAVLVRHYEIEDYVSMFDGKYLGDDRELRKQFGL